MLIKEIYNTAIVIQKRLQGSDYMSEDEGLRLREQFYALKAMLSYIWKGDWACENTRKKLLLYMKSEFDVKLVCESFNTSPECFYVFLNRQERRLQKIMGESYNLIYSGRIAEGLRAFNIATCSINIRDEIYYNTRELLPTPKCVDGITVSDCKAELDILSSLTKTSQKNFFADYDAEKLSHLLFLLTTKDRAYQGQRKQLIAALINADR